MGLGATSTLVSWRVVLVVLVAFLGLQAHGRAQTPDEPELQTPTLSLSPSEGRSGSTVTASGKHYCGPVELAWDGETLVLNSRDNSGEPDPDGNISFEFTVPADEPGRHTVTSDSPCGGTEASFKVVITPPTTTAPSPTTTVPRAAPPPPMAAEEHQAPPSPPAPEVSPPAAEAPQPAPDGARDSYEESTLARYEDIIKRELESGVILYNPPEQMRVGIVNRVEVRIAREELEDIAGGLQGKGDPRVEQLLVGTTMRAKLEGGAFDITLIGSDVQQLTSKGFREWQWDVIPTSSGDHSLFFTVSVLHEKYPNGIEHKVFERRIDVAVNPGYSLSKWLSNNWEKPVGALVGIIGIIEGYRRLRLRRADDRSAA